MLDTLMGWLRTRADRDGQAPALETGERGSKLIEPQEATTPRGRRSHLPSLPAETLDRSLASKVLQGWLENQQQTLVPLTFRLNRLNDDAVRVLMRFAAVSCLSGPTFDANRQAAIVRWLRSIGADDRALGEFTASLEQDYPLSPLIRAIQTYGLEPQSYAVAVMATDQRHPTGRLFANYVAARLELPADAIRSVDRQCRR